MKPEDFEKIFTFFRAEFEKVKRELKEELLQIVQVEVAELKDGLIGLKHRQDEDYAMVNVRIENLEERVTKHSREISTIKNKVKLS